jgi:hypothetical protein
MGRLHQLSRTQLVGRPLPEVFASFSDASNLDALTPVPRQKRNVGASQKSSRARRSRRNAWAMSSEDSLVSGTLS